MTIKNNIAIPPRIEWIFFSDEERRLRAGWRLLVFIPILVVCVYIGDWITETILQLAGWDRSGISMSSWTFAEVIGVTVAVFISRKIIDGRSISSLGLHVNAQTLWDCLAGIIISACILGLICLIEYAMGRLKFNGFVQDFATHDITYPIVFLLSDSWSETLLFYGYLLQTLQSGLTRFWGILTLHLPIIFLFGVYEPSLNNFIISILFFTFYLVAFNTTGNLWICISLTFGASFFDSIIFGSPIGRSRIVAVVSGSEQWTGQILAPERDWLMIPVLIFGFGLLILYLKLFKKIYQRVDEKDLS